MDSNSPAWSFLDLVPIGRRSVLVIHAALAALLQTSMIGADPLSYQQAYEENAKTGKPLVVLVGADWCGACRVMKSQTLPQVVGDEVFKHVAFTVIDTDTQGEIARQVTGGGSIPQLVIFHRDGNGWKHERLVGAQSPRAVLQFLKRGLQVAADRLTPGQ
jgi:thioredoxin-like negative regulator of GroEL